MSHRAIFLPNNWLLTYEPHSFPIVLSAHGNDQWSFISKLHGKKDVSFHAKNEHLWFSVASEVSVCDGPGSIWLSYYFKKYAQNQRMKFPMVKTEKCTWHWNGQIGDFKLYNAIWGKKNGKKQPVVIGLSALFIRPVACRRRPDIISLRKHWSRDLFQKHERLWLEQGCHSQRFPFKAVFMFFCHSNDFLETICFFFLYQQGRLEQPSDWTLS